MKLKITLFSLLFLIIISIVIAGSLNVASHTTRDFGKMYPKESKTLGYYVKGFYEVNETYYSICLNHPLEGEISKWIRLKVDESENKSIYPNQTCRKGHTNNHWVGPELGVTWKKNVFVTLKVPPQAKPGNYSMTVNNIACGPNKGKRGINVGVCNSVPTTIKVEVIK